MSFRNRRSPYSNSHNRTRTRMDMRDQTDPATMAGVRNTHRDMNGNVIGGQDRYGRRFTSGSGIMQGGKRAPFYRQPVQAPAVAATTPSVAPKPANRPPTALPVMPASMTRPSAPGRPAMPTAATAKPALPESKLTPQIATSTPGTAPAGSKDQPRINRLTGKPFGYTPPAGGAQTAKDNIARLGLAGAVADYQKRSASDAAAQVAANQAGQARSKFRAATAPVAAPPSPVPTKPATFQQAAGLPAQSPEKALAARFAVPPVANPQSIGATPASPPPAPASQFAQLTAPKPIAAPAQSPAPTSSFRRPVTPAAVQSGPSFTTPEAVSARGDAKLAARKASMQSTKDAAYNRQPDLPIVAPDSLANKAYKGLRARWTTP